MKRLDVTLVELQMAPSRNKAQSLISAGEVEVFLNGAWKCVEHASYALVDITPQMIRVKSDSQTLKYVSRGGLKLEAALAHLRLKVSDWKCLDLGVSTGGFADCLLQAGAASVTGYDVGHGQLDPRLQEDARIRHFEGVNVRELRLSESFDLCVLDLSFISLLLVIPVLGEQLAPETKLLALVKPQFEVGAKNLNKKGVVENTALFADVQSRVLRAFENCGFSTLDYFACAVKGQDGNQEFFAYLTRS